MTYSLLSLLEKAVRFIRIHIKKCYWKLKYGKRIKFGKNFKFRKGLIINIAKNGYLEIGDRCSFNNYCSINCHKRIIIKDDNMFGEGVRMYDHNHIFNDKTVDIKTNFDEREIKIGSNNWFASNIIILSKAKVGDNNVFGANTVVNAEYGSECLIRTMPEVSVSKIRYKGALGDAKKK